jgi:hypothetical protein
MHWIHLTQHKDKWWTLVNIMNLHIPLNAGHIWTSCGPLATEGGFFFLELGSLCLNNYILDDLFLYFYVTSLQRPSNYVLCQLSALS